MKILFTTMFCIASACAAQAQSWSIEADGGIALPPSVGGVSVDAARIDCTPRGWLLALPRDLPFGDGTGAPYGVILSVDGRDFQTIGDYATSEILIPDGSIVSLKAGTEMTLLLPSGSQMVRVSFSLAGSGDALSEVEASCGN